MLLRLIDIWVLSVLAMIRAHISHNTLIYQIQSTKFIAYFMIMRIHTMYTCIQSYSYFTVYCVHYTHHIVVRIVCKRPAAHTYMNTYSTRYERMCVNYNYLIFFIIWLIWYWKHATQYIRTQTHQQPQPIQDSYGWNTQKQQISSVERAIIRWQKERQKHKHISHASATITTAYIIGKTFEFYIQSCWFFRSNHSVFFEGARIKKLKKFCNFPF